MHSFPLKLPSIVSINQFQNVSKLGLVHLWMSWTIFVWPCERGTSVLSGAVFYIYAQQGSSSLWWSKVCLEVGKWWPGLLQCHRYTSLFLDFLCHWFFRAATRGFRDAVHHPYISTCFVGNAFTPLIEFIARTGWTMHSSDAFIYGREWSWVGRQAERVDEAQQQQLKGKDWVRASKEAGWVDQAQLVWKGLHIQIVLPAQALDPAQLQHFKEKERSQASTQAPTFLCMYKSYFSYWAVC